jgi:hypothetical protein
MDVKTEAKRRLVAHAATIDFERITETDFSRWIDALPLDEFSALIGAHAAGEVLGPDLDGAVSPLEPHGDDWTPYVPNGEYPLPTDQLVWVMFSDGEVMGPNRTAAFLWGGTGQAEIIAYAPAVPGTVLPKH